MKVKLITKLKSHISKKDCFKVKKEISFFPCHWLILFGEGYVKNMYLTQKGNAFFIIIHLVSSGEGIHRL